MRWLLVLVCVMFVTGHVTQAQSTGSKKERIPAKKQFGYVVGPAPLQARSIGFYTKGCLAGGVALPINGPSWQAMRLSRNRNWGHPALIKYLKRLATDAQKYDSWPGLLVGDLAQPRGGPMLTGHRSHQVGLDADIWLTPMPSRRLSYREREEISATSMLASNVSINRRVWTKAHVRFLKRAVSYPEVERIFVHPVIKKALCDAAGKNKSWLAKIRPYWGHHYHMHVRIGCPRGSRGCKPQAAPPTSHRCGKEIDYWFKLLSRPPPLVIPGLPKRKAKPKPQLTLASLPKDCSRVLSAGAPPLLNSSVAPTRPISALPRRRPRRN